jgi:hypothetical protein
MPVVPDQPCARVGVEDVGVAACGFRTPFLRDGGQHRFLLPE